MGAQLRSDRLTKVYGDGDAKVVAVDNVSLDISPGDFVLIMGPSGSGKTTLLSMFGALLRPSAGRIWIDDLEITGLPARQLPGIRLRRLGFVFQMFNLLENLTALENVRIVIEAAGDSKRQADARARQLLGLLKMSSRLDWLPEKLSGGERQRVAIARAVANDPPLILADEPTGNLDSRTGYEVMHMFHTLAKERGKTVVIVTHDRRIADMADNVLWLEDGRVTAKPSDDAWLMQEPEARELPDQRSIPSAE
jgi:putative ABC transport system ATP-binding protein